MTDDLIKPAEVRRLCGGISEMTLWRRSKDPQCGFPKPIYINKRRFWKKQEILDWIDRQPTSLPKPDKKFWCAEIDGQYVFTCPSCGEQHYHSAEDGHRVSHCECWPNGYVLVGPKADKGRPA